ncbi:MAG: MotA/TolQ/ExbB proton channel family protein [Chitinophagales bacterium]|jgi:biopolymer transport protein ExbB|nr:MotA/TolQ/ExbB proton channel family protein [Sphingobacteriales bacterium]MBP7533906.1 MotA/TolQ/ExbB proton channel family protein [Chitinophagales bacterium]
MSTATKGSVEKAGKGSSMFATIVIPVAFLICILIYMFVLGSPANFAGGDSNNHPLPGNYLGIVYKGGIMVPVLMSLMLIVIIFCFERLFTLTKAAGSGSVENFVRKVQASLSSNDIGTALNACDQQKGSVANVIRAGLLKYREVQSDTIMDKDQKVSAIQKEVEEATSLELPMLEKNLVILATISSVATLMGLLGTVIGMIKAFAALATAGSPDAVALANGISEALINTALGIGTSAIAIIMYNYFTTKIDGLTYSIDEIGFSLAQTFASKN